MYNLIGCYHLVAVTVNFEKSSYTIEKFNVPPAILLQLSEKLPTDVTIKVRDKEGTATSKSTELYYSTFLIAIYI